MVPRDLEGQLTRVEGIQQANVKIFKVWGVQWTYEDADEAFGVVFLLRRLWYRSPLIDHHHLQYLNAIGNEISIVISRVSHYHS